ncbi:MAG: FkbM family methyltransferase [Bacteroidia bacterium]|nr:FkbM family methyltransferase [Bacteroidia bacterium]
MLSRFGLLDKVRSTSMYRELAFRFNSQIRKALKAEMFFYSQFVTRGDFCFDIGASVGGKATVFQKIGARILAAEPDPSAFAELTKKFGGKKNVVLMNKGLGSTLGELILNRADMSTLSTFDDADVKTTLSDSRFSGVEFNHKVSVEITTLDRLISDYGMPNYCKISTVGYEMEVLKGLSKPIKIISFTCNVPQHIYKTIECVTLIDKLGDYRYNYFLSTLLNGFVSNKWLTGAEMKNKLSEMQNIPEHSRYIELFAVQNQKQI